MNISQKTIDKLKLDYTVNLMDEGMYEVEPAQATHISIGWEITNGEPSGYIGKYIKTPVKKEVTYEWVLEKINKQSVFVNFCDKFNAFLKTKGLRGYATSYGIGIESLFVGSSNLKEEKVSIENELDSLGIKYTTEYSEAHWVFRYKISQSKENMKKLENSLK